MRATLLTLAVATLALSACNRGSTSQTDSGATVEESGKSIDNPFAAMKNISEAAQKMADKAKEMENRKPVDPVKFDVMLPLLPEPAGWKAGEAKGETTAAGEWKFSTVSRSYEKGEGENQSRVKIDIVDGAHISMLYMGFTMMSQLSTESTEGHTKGITIDGFPAVEEWKKKSKDAKVIALVNDRYLVTIDGDNVEPELVREWAGLVDLKKVAKLQ